MIPRSCVIRVRPVLAGSAVGILPIWVGPGWRGGAAGRAGPGRCGRSRRHGRARGAGCARAGRRCAGIDAPLRASGERCRVPATAATAACGTPAGGCAATTTPVRQASAAGGHGLTYAAIISARLAAAGGCRQATRPPRCARRWSLPGPLAAAARPQARARPRSCPAQRRLLGNRGGPPEHGAASSPGRAGGSGSWSLAAKAFIVSPLPHPQPPGQGSGPAACIGHRQAQPAARHSERHERRP